MLAIYDLWIKTVENIFLATKNEDKIGPVLAQINNAAVKFETERKINFCTPSRILASKEGKKTWFKFEAS